LAAAELHGLCSISGGRALAAVMIGGCALRFTRVRFSPGAACFSGAARSRVLPEHELSSGARSSRPGSGPGLASARRFGCAHTSRSRVFVASLLQPPTTSFGAHQAPSCLAIYYLLYKSHAARIRSPGGSPATLRFAMRVPWRAHAACRRRRWTRCDTANQTVVSFATTRSAL
jgi:hypothetical protein